jgi:hypothetical protein
MAREDNYEGPSDEPEERDPYDYLDRTAKAAAAGHTSPDESLWSSDEALDALRMERTVHGNETPVEQTNRMLRDAGPMAAASIINIALHSANDNTRFNAAKYITDWSRETEGAGGAAWEDLVAEAISKAEVFANAPGGSPEQDD